jgi:Ca2+-binding EF-hand superfamily protein
LITRKVISIVVIADNLERLFQKQDIISSKFKGDKGLNLKEFTKVLKENGITNDQELINKLFWVFDEDGSGDIEYKELAFGLEMFRDSSFENKIKGNNP